MKALFVIIVAVAFAGGACSKKQSDKPAAADAAPAAPTAAADAAPPAIDAGSEEAEAIPTAEDFEEEAAAAVTEKNLAKELEAIEAELGE